MYFVLYIFIITIITSSKIVLVDFQLDIHKYLLVINIATNLKTILYLKKKNESKT